MTVIPHGNIEVIDSKTGRAKGQAEVDLQEQLSLYALALRSGAVRNLVSGSVLTGASRLTLYFTESDLAVSTSRNDDQLDAFAEGVIATARRIRAADFAATPDHQRRSWCDYRRLFPGMWEE